MAKVMVAMSGGVDSSVAAALLLEQGHEVVGATLRLLPEGEFHPSSHPCCLSRDVEDAQAVCHRLGIPHYVLNYENQFQSLVIDYSLRQYMEGRTPNPCLQCNQEVKFRLLLQRALALGLDYLATGHYARIGCSGAGFTLLRGSDKAKDQSYFLFTLGQEELKHLLFPVGGYAKAEVRALARQWGLPVAEKEESQDICFAPQGYRPFLSCWCQPIPGDIVNGKGEVLGHHAGIANFTIGQRRGLGVASPRPYYVVSLDPQSQRVVVGEEAGLYAPGLRAGSVSWLNGGPASWPMAAAARIRYRAAEAEALVYPGPPGEVSVHFAQPQKAITPGQAVVFYHGEGVLGGGIIEEVLHASRF